MIHRRFPVYRQHDAIDCGPTCLKMIAKHYGKEISLEILKRECQTGHTIDGQSVSLELRSEELMLILQGICLSSVRRRKRFHFSGSETTLSKMVCKAGPQTDCSRVMRSKLGTVYADISFSEIGLLFFAGCLITRFVGRENDSVLLASLSLAVIPITLFSIYYQWRVVKTWCSLCLSVVTVLWAQAVYYGFIIDKSIFSLEDINTITLVTSPMCDPCIRAHNLINRWLDHYPDQLRVVLRFAINQRDQRNEANNISKKLISLALRKDHRLPQAIHQWYNTQRKVDEWSSDFTTNLHPATDEIFLKHEAWTRKNFINATPIIFFNGKQIPEEYSLQEFEYFLNSKLFEVSEL